MGGVRTGTEPRAMSRPLQGIAQVERQARRDRADARRRLTATAAYLLAGAVLFVVYLRLSQTYPADSDSANILLMAWDLLHGNLLLHGWFMSDVSFYPTELPQYALLESFLGPHFATAHVAAAMTYTLVFLLAVILARSGSSGRAAWIRTLIAAGILLAPQFGAGVFALDLSVGHIGTSIPLMLTWLVLDRMRPGWRVPVLTGVLLAWVLVADPIVYIVGAGPLGVVAAARVIRDWRNAGDGWRRRLAAARYDLSLGAASVAAVVLAWIVNNVLSALGGFTVNRLPFYFTAWSDIVHNVQAFWKILVVYGANVDGAGGIWLALAILHLVSVVIVAWACCRVFRWFFAVSLVDQVLAVAIVLNIVLYGFTNASSEAAHEVAVIAPFGAALAARVLVPVWHGYRTAATTGRRVTRRRGRIRRAAGRLVPRRLVPRRLVPRRLVPRRLVPRRLVPRRLVPRRSDPRRARRVRLAAWIAGIAVLAGYVAGLGYELVQPSAPPANTDLASFLLAHDLRYGLSGYWTSSSVTVDSDGKVQVRALAKATVVRDMWMSSVGWYDPTKHYANFIVLDSGQGFMNKWEPLALVTQYFGHPARVYLTGSYTILVYDKNLLRDIPPGSADQ